MRDAFGRRVDYLRISVTDRCNLRCAGCRPGRVTPLPRERLLTPVEIETVTRVAVGLGFRKVRLTGGEPTLRPDLVEIVERLASLRGVEDLALTTNGTRLTDLARPLARAGLHRVNVHLDSLDAGRLAAVMRRGSLAVIRAGLDAAEAAGLRPLKLNCIAQTGNLRDVVALAALTRRRPWAVRFIEKMPLGDGAEPGGAFVSGAVVRRRLETSLGRLEPLPAGDPAASAALYRLPGARGRIGLIRPRTEPFCGRCSRLRVTAEGRLRPCLLRDAEIDLRGPLREGVGEDAVARLLARAVAAKPEGHGLAQGIRPRSEMSRIGG
jgi:cyclic pyranopterin phosphate synthase